MKRHFTIIFLTAVFLTAMPLSACSQTTALVSVSVTDMKEDASYTSPTVSQAMMGTPVKITDHKSYWYKITTPEGYQGWTTEMNVSIITDEEFRKWKDSPRGIVTSYFETIMSAPDKDSDVIGNCIMGNILETTGETENGYFAVMIPGVGKGYIPCTALSPFKETLETMEVSEETIAATAEKFLGFPYLWGGLSPMGLDCSGLVKLSYFLNGIILKRDAKEQICTGERIEVTPDFKNLKKGDLVFFGTPASASAPAKVTHVGIYIENGEFIHSSLIVRRNNLAPGRNDSYTRKKIVGACRILGHQDLEEGITSILKHPWYFNIDE